MKNCKNAWEANKHQTKQQQENKRTNKPNVKHKARNTLTEWNKKSSKTNLRQSITDIAIPSIIAEHPFSATRFLREALQTSTVYTLRHLFSKLNDPRLTRPLLIWKPFHTFGHTFPYRGWIGLINSGTFANTFLLAAAILKTFPERKAFCHYAQ